MEKDRFDETLKQLVVKADQMRSNSSDKERVWKNINRPGRSKRFGTMPQQLSFYA